jgi:hypothetical protein
MNYPIKHLVKKPRRLADYIEHCQRFQIQVGGQRSTGSVIAIINIEHERGDSSEELEFQLKWSLES